MDSQVPESAVWDIGVGARRLGGVGDGDGVVATDVHRIKMDSHPFCAKLTGHSATVMGENVLLIDGEDAWLGWETWRWMKLRRSFPGDHAAASQSADVAYLLDTRTCLRFDLRTKVMHQICEVTVQGVRDMCVSDEYLVVAGHEGCTTFDMRHLQKPVRHEKGYTRCVRTGDGNVKIWRVDESIVYEHGQAKTVRRVNKEGPSERTNFALVNINEKDFLIHGGIGRQRCFSKRAVRFDHAAYSWQSWESNVHQHSHREPPWRVVGLGGLLPENKPATYECLNPSPSRGWMCKSPTGGS